MPMQTQRIQNDSEMQSVLKKGHKGNQSEIRPSDCALRTTNPIRNIVDRLQVPDEHLRRKKLLSLALGDPTAYLNPPDELIQAVENKLVGDKQNSINAFGYPPATGYDVAKAAIATRANHYNHKLFQELEGEGVNAPQQYSKEDVILASGCSGSLDLAIKVLCSATDTILIPKPGFSLYRTISTSLNLDIHEYRLIPELSWEIDLVELERFISTGEKRISAWIINNPSNPCGSVYSLKHLEGISRLALKYNIPLISDEIYEDMTFTPHIYIPMSIVHKGPLITCSGLAKRFLVPGWRIGWMLIHDGYVEEEGKSTTMQQVRKGLVDLAGLILGPNSLIQVALYDIFSNVPPTFYQNINAYLHNNSLLCTKILSDIPGLRVIPPQGTLYLLVSILPHHFPNFKDDVEFCQALLGEELVSCLPGSIFGADGFIRIVFAAPEDVLREALMRLKSFAGRHFQG
jgi:tyrosine aminotransferase